MAADYSAAKDSPLFARRKDAADNWSFPPSVMNIVVPKDVLPGFQFPESTFFIVPPNSDDHSIADGPDHPQFGRVSGLLSQEDAYCGSAGRGLRSARRPPPDLCKLDAGLPREWTGWSAASGFCNREKGEKMEQSDFQGIIPGERLSLLCLSRGGQRRAFHPRASAGGRGGPRLLHVDQGDPCADSGQPLNRQARPLPQTKNQGQGKTV